LLALDYRLVFDSFADAVVAADSTGQILYANAAAEKLLGWPVEELVGRPLLTIIPPRLRAIHQAGFQRYLTTHISRLIGQPVRVPALRRDGTEADVELSLTAFRLEDGKDLFLAALRDLSERVELERQITITRYLRATTEAAAKLASRLDLEHVLQTIVQTLVADFDAALARIWLHDKETNMLRLRASAGLSTETTASSRACIDVATYPYKVGVVARTRKPFIRISLAGDPNFDQEWVQRERIASAAVYPLQITDELLGVLVYFSRQPLPEEVVEALANFVTIVTASIHDVHLLAREQAAREIAEKESAERRQAEEALRVSEARYRALVEQSPLSIQILAPDGRTLLVNRAWEELWGVALDKIPDYNLLQDPQLVEKGVMPYIQKAFAGEATAIPAIPYNPDETLPGRTRHKNPQRWVRAFIYPLKDVAGKVWEVVLIHEDITDQQQYEEALSQSREHIAALYERLQRAMVETHHRVKNNLQIITSLLDMRLMEYPQAIPAAEIRRLSMHVQTLAAIHEILTQEAKGGSQAESLSATEIFDRLLPLLGQTAGGRPIEADVEDVRLSARQGTALALVVNELISNAIKYGRGTVKLTLHVQEQTATLAVCNDGSGFPPGFHPATSAHTGLELVERLSRWDLGGAVHYENRPEGGAWVRVLISLSAAKRP